MKISKDLSKNIAAIQEAFRDCGDIIMREGQTYDEMYKVVSGSVEVYIRYGEKDEHLIGIYSKSKCFGEMSVLSEQASIYTVVAFDEVLLMRMTL